MHLKRLEMRGFKTFAQRTEIEFGPGLTAIVGPNGVGKSNIADAVVWALGEQSQRAVRAQTSLDVIFAGSDTRSPLGMAEVRLVLDNADEMLPIDFSEVEVCRRLFRTGESEYAINNAPCRLRDIHDLFVDTGVGQQAYSLVGQGEIDAILSVRSEDRRELIEEVAGIGKYRRRRKEAQRKLDDTEANVRRVSDIIYELTSQREPLEQQAVKARQYRELDGSLRELELKLLALDYRKRRHELGKLANDQHVGGADLEGTRSQLSLLDAESERIAADLHKLETELERVREQAREAEREAERTERAHAVSTEKLRAAQERLAELDEANEDDNGREQQLTEHLGHLRDQQEEARGRADQVGEELAALREGLEKRQAQQEEQAERLRSLEQEHQQCLQVAAGHEREAEALASIQQELRERVQRLVSQREVLESRQQEAEEGLLEVKAQRDRLAAQVEEARRTLAERSRQRELLTRTLREHRAKREILAGAGTAAEARLALLEELERGHEGYNEAVRQVLAAAQAGELVGIQGVVGDVIEVPARYEVAIEAALGERLQWIVVNTQEQALAAVDYLRSHGAGCATFLPLSSLSAVAPRTATPAGEGCIGVAARMVRSAREMAAVVEHLLGDALVMRDLRGALKYSRRLGYQARAVTLAGEVIERSGAIRSGALEKDAAQLFGRKRELEQVRAHLDELKRSLAATWECEEGLEQAAQALARQVEEMNGSAGDMRAALSELDRDLVHLSDQAQVAHQAVAEVDEETEALQGKLQETVQREEQARREAAEARENGAAVEARIEAARAEQGSSEELEQQRAELVQREVTLAELREKERSIEALVEQATEELGRLGREREAANGAEEKLRSQVGELSDELERMSGELAQQRGQAEQQSELVNERVSAARELRDKSDELETSRRKLRRVLEEQHERLQHTEISLTREQAQLEHIVQRLADVYEIKPEQAVADLGDEEIERRQLAREVNRLKREIRQLGHVNLSAIDECERLSARESFLKEQRDDLEAAREDLVEIIEEIDTAAEQEFMTSFEQIAEAFSSTFSQLFGGGSTQLFLSDPGNPLESGVEVVAQPPGKRQKNLLSLSGGERAMTALALLFAMLKVKPSPFCVLDEIDAALDASNTDRFVDLLKDFAERSQFIIITHNPRTMEEADLLHGVTMQEPGVSERISVELREAQRQAEERTREERAQAAQEPPEGEPVAEIAGS